MSLSIPITLSGDNRLSPFYALSGYPLLTEGDETDKWYKPHSVPLGYCHARLSEIKIGTRGRGVVGGGCGVVEKM